MLEIRTTDSFDSWFTSLRDAAAKRRIQVRIDRIQMGNFGDIKCVGGAISELRVDHGPGYRVYCTRRGNALVVLPGGGNKASQAADIRAARKLAQHLDLG